jgi:putative ABC transport system permease protein
MKFNLPLAWLQLSREKNRLLIAMAGIAFADILMFMQLGFQSALYASNTRLHRSLKADLILVSPQAQNLTNLFSFPRRRLYQAMNSQDVESADALYAYLVAWKHPETRANTRILVVGFNPAKSFINLPEVNQNLDKVKLSDTSLFDRKTRGNYKASIAKIEQGQTVSTEIEGRKTNINGLFTIGASFASDGILITSDQSYMRMFTNKQATQVNVGLIKLKSGADAKQVAATLKTNLPDDVKVMTLTEFVALETNHWAHHTPIGFIFSVGTVLGFFVGTVIVYQILYSNVAEHLPEYATLKAIGFKDNYLLGVVIQEALILAVLGYLPGCAISFGLYALTRNATNLPLFMSIARAVGVLLLTILMCLISGGIAVRKLKTADPAEIF